MAQDCIQDDIAARPHLFYRGLQVRDGVGQLEDTSPSEEPTKGGFGLRWSLTGSVFDWSWRSDLIGDPFLIRIVDDDLAVRQSLDGLLRVAGYETRLYDGVLSLLASLPESGDGCVLLNVQMRGITGLQLIGQMRSNGIRLPVIVMTGVGEVRSVVRAMRSGTVDFVEKPFTTQTLLNAIEAARVGARIVSNPIPVIEEARAAVDSLSGRERQVLMGLAKGQQQKVIAHELGISARTVEVHRARMLRRLGTRYLADAIRIAVLAELGRSFGTATAD